MRRFSPPRPKLNDQSWSIERDRRPYGVRTPYFDPIADQSAEEDGYFTFTPGFHSNGYSATFGIDGYLPGGLAINPATGQLFGTIDGYGTFDNLRFYATYSLGIVYSELFTIEVEQVIPEPVAGMTLWVDASDTATITIAGIDDPNDISAWNDKSGNARHLSSLGTPRPILQSNIQNGLHAIYFNEGGNFGDGVISNIITGTTFTAFIAFKPETIDSNEAVAEENNGLWCAHNGYVGMYLKGSGTYSVMIQNLDSGADDFAAATIPGLNQAMQATGRHESGSIYVSVNGGAESSAASGNTQFTNGQFNVSRGYDGAAAAKTKFNGHIFEILVYNTALSAADRLQNESYLRLKWGLP